MTDHGRLSKIRKLLALAEDPGATTAEAAAFTEKAMALMARHGIDEALVAEEAGGGRVRHRRLAMPSPYARDKATLACGIAEASRCKAVMIKSGRSIVVQVFGYDADLHNVEALFTSLLVQAALELAGATIPPTEHAAAFRRSWWAGFSTAVYTRLLEATRIAEEEAEDTRLSDSRGPAGGPSVALVLSRLADEIDDELAKEYPNVRHARRRRLSGSGHAKGFQSGHRVDLGTMAKVAAR
jgi:hypothetical protein